MLKLETLLSPDWSYDKILIDYRTVYTERDHEREGGVRTGLRIRNLYETVYTKGDHERGWKLVRAEILRDCLQSEYLDDDRTNYYLSTNQFFFRVTWPR